MDKFNLLSDQPLKSEADFENARFGHKEIAETLTSLIINCPTPFTIGLFGRWGAGKSTISYMLKKAITENKVGFILFDVWKHESDALRRTFLKESVNQLKEQGSIATDFNLEERLDSKVTRKVEGHIKLKGFFKNYLKAILCVFLYLILVGILIYRFFGFERLSLYVSIVLSIFTGGGILTAIISKTMSHFLTSETITHEIDRFNDPHEFQSEFEKLLSNLKTDKILVVFDNLDRVIHEKAVEILATIKTFLETENVKDKGVVFLIPCDDQAIKEHLRNVYKLSDGEKDAFNEEEFLRKFFNTTLRIPDFYPTELETYAMELLSQTGIPELKEGSVAWLITKAYRGNPRQIKQFINQLIGMYILTKKRIEKNSLPKDFIDGGLSNIILYDTLPFRRSVVGDFPVDIIISGNIPKLTKFLILYNKFPKQMEELRQRKIWNLEQVILETGIILKDSNFTEFNKFLNETAHIAINNLNIFFTLRKSEFEVQLPGYSEFATALQDNRLDEATSYIQGLTEFSTKKAVLSQAIKKLLEETSLPDTKISIINSCLTALSRVNERLEDLVYVEMVNELSNLKQYLYIIDPRVVFKQLLNPYPHYRDDFAQSYVNILVQTEDKTKLPLKFVEALFSEIINNAEWFKQHIDKISNILSEKYYDQPQIIQLLLINEQSQKTFAIGKILQKTLSILSPADLESGKPFDEKLKLLVDTIPDILDKQLLSTTIIKLREILTNENSKPFDSSRIEIQKRFSKGITSLFNKHTPSFSTKSEQAEKDNFCQTLLQAVNRIGDWGQRNIYIEPLILLSTIGTTHSAQTINIARQFIDNAPFKNLKDAFEDKDEKEWNKLLSDNNYTEYFKQRALREQAIFDYLYTYLTETQKRDWLLALLEIDPIRGMQKIESLDIKVPDTENVLKKLLTIAGRVDINNRFKAYEICDKLKFANNDELLQQACEDAKKHLTTLDETSQKFGFNLSINISSFSDEHKRDIARGVIDWLISLQPPQKNQPFAIRAILHLWTTLSGQQLYQSRFIEFIFSLLFETTNIDAIRLGLEVLNATRPNYNDFPKYYDDLKHRAETEHNAQLKELLIHGFKELKKLKGEDADWWKWINSME